MTKVLVTGGAGYIGSHVVDQLINQGYEVVVFDNLSTGHQSAIHPKAHFIYGDLLDRKVLNNTFKEHNFDGIFHFASNTLVGESMQKPWLYLRDNVLAASNLLEEAVTHNVLRFVFSSTANLFAEPHEIPIRETEPVVPGSPYGESKFSVERQLHWMSSIYDLQYCCLRYFNAAGAHPNGHIGEDHTPETHLIPIAIQTALGKSSAITVYGDDYETPDGTCIRDYVHVMDLASAHILVFEHLMDGISRAYNLGNGRGYSVKEVIQTVSSVSGQSIPVTIAQRRLGDPAILIADSRALETQFGWTRQYSDLREIVETAWHWHRTHLDGYGSSIS